MFIFEKRLTIKIVVDRSLFIFWKRQNRIFFYTTITLSIVYLFERRNSLYYYYWTTKFQLYTIYNWRIILINTLYFLFSISNIRDFVNFAIFFTTTFLFFQKQNIKHISILIVWIFITNNEKKRLRKIVIIDLIKFLKRFILKRFNQNTHLLTISIFVRTFSSFLKRHYSMFDREYIIHDTILTNKTCIFVKKSIDLYFNVRNNDFDIWFQISMISIIDSFIWLKSFLQSHHDFFFSIRWN